MSKQELMTSAIKWLTAYKDTGRVAFLDKYKAIINQIKREV